MFFNPTLGLKVLCYCGSSTCSLETNLILCYIVTIFAYFSTFFKPPDLILGFFASLQANPWG